MEITSPAQPQTLRSRIIFTDLVAWRDLQFIQQDDFKELPKEARAKLRESILANEFTQPFYVWLDCDSGINYCLDGKHRTLILEELIADGYNIPLELPATFIDCKDKKEAAALVLTYSSIYAKITQQGLFDFLEMYELNFQEMMTGLDLPGFSSERFEQKFDLFHLKNSEADDCEVILPPVDEIIIKTGDLVQLGNHRVICGSFQDPAVQNSLMQNTRARILITDPPYNIPASVYSHQGHKDFAMAAGEMGDEEFVKFLQGIMHAAVAHTLPGAIHYIFMDWRHNWHITEAGRRVYGSPVPKQMCVWVKDLFANGSFYRAQQELCFIFSDEQAKALWNRDMLDQGGFYKTDDELVFVFKNPDGAKHLSHLELKDRTRSNIWKYPSAVRVKGAEYYDVKDHPTPKPVAMISDAILDTTNAGDIVIDWFLGSGTTIIAAEKTDRICYGAEIEPGFVQAIIVRYISYCEKTGREIIFKHLTGSLTLKDFTHAKSNGSGKNN